MAALVGGQEESRGDGHREGIRIRIRPSLGGITRIFMKCLRGWQSWILIELCMATIIMIRHTARAPWELTRPPDGERDTLSHSILPRCLQPASRCRNNWDEGTSGISRLVGAAKLQSDRYNPRTLCRCIYFGRVDRLWICGRFTERAAC